RKILFCRINHKSQMRKSVFGRQLGRTSNQRKALFRALISALIKHGQIKTTLAKAKAVKGQAEKLITRARKGSLTDRRVILRCLGKRELVNRLVDEIAPSLGERKSGYLRILRLEKRKGDNAQQALLAFVDELPAKEKVEKPAKKADKKVEKEHHDKTD
ncbi:MAG: 50S ribosomal protein L17, partial [Microgenomates group bacterium]